MTIKELKLQDSLEQLDEEFYLRHDDDVVLIEREQLYAHRATRRISRPRSEIDDFSAHPQFVIRLDRREPAQLVDAGTEDTGFAQNSGVDDEPHRHGRG